MRTIRIAAAAPRDGRRLPFGSSEWAADSCLAEWSQFEREWLGPDPHAPRRGGSSRHEETERAPSAAAWAGVAVGVWAVLAWSLLGNSWGF